MLDRDGNIIMGDFGTAKLIDQQEIEMLKGEQSYMLFKKNNNIGKMASISLDRPVQTSIEERIRR